MQVHITGLDNTQVCSRKYLIVKSLWKAFKMKFRKQSSVVYLLSLNRFMNVKHVEYIFLMYYDFFSKNEFAEIFNHFLRL